MPEPTACGVESDGAARVALEGRIQWSERGVSVAIVGIAAIECNEVKDTIIQLMKHLF